MPIPTPLIAEQLAEFVRAVDLADCPQAVVSQARRVLVDTVGCMIAGSGNPVVSRLMAILGRGGGEPPECTIPGRMERLGLSEAALANGTAAHALELDDGHTRGSAHPGAVVVPAALAAAEKLGLSLGAALEATIVGYEVMLSIASAIHPRSRRRGFHNTAVAGVFGAAASAAKLLRLSPREVCHCLGLAGSFASGLLAFWNPGEQGSTDVKKLHPGKAARDGLFCALAAEQGLRGPATVFEGAAGVFASYAGDKCSIKVPTADFRDPEIMKVYIKPWPCCRSLHGPIALALRLRDRLGEQIDRITTIRVDTYSLASERSPCSAEGDDAQFSIPVAVATALARGCVTYETLIRAQADSAVRSLAQLVSVSEDVEFTARYPAARPARLTVAMADGSCISSELDYPPGEPECPVSDAMVEEKFIENSAPIIGKQRARLIFRHVMEGDLDMGCRELLALSGKSGPTSRFPDPYSAAGEAQEVSWLQMGGKTGN